MAQPILIKYPIEVEGIARPPAPKEPPVAIDYVAAKRYSQEVDLSNRGQKGEVRATAEQVASADAYSSGIMHAIHGSELDNNMGIKAMIREMLQASEANVMRGVQEIVKRSEATMIQEVKRSEAAMLREMKKSEANMQKMVDEAMASITPKLDKIHIIAAKSHNKTAGQGPWEEVPFMNGKLPSPDLPPLRHLANLQELDTASCKAYFQGYTGEAPARVTRQRPQPVTAEERQKWERTILQAMGCDLPHTL